MLRPVSDNVSDRRNGWQSMDIHQSNRNTAASRILRLDEVAAAAREPDFFELLQAGILSGSLGQNTGGGVTGGNVFPDVHMSNSTHHILSIGAAIIDQADPDSIPMRIQFNPSGTLWTAYGVENLPYITQMYPIAGTSPNDPTQMGNLSVSSNSGTRIRMLPLYPTMFVSGSTVQSEFLKEEMAKLGSVELRPKLLPTVTTLGSLLH